VRVRGELVPDVGARYVDPGNRYVAAFALPWRRGVAAAVDWGLCFVAFLVVSIPLGSIEALGALSLEEGDLNGVPGRVLVVVTQLLTVAPAVLYFALLLPTSQTYGMRLSDIRIVSTGTGRAPSYPLAAIRAVAGTIMAAAVYGAFHYWSSFEKPSHLDSTSIHIIDAAFVVAGAACISALTMLFSPTNRSIVDRLSRTAVLDELEAVVPRMGPWGPLDAFDTSHQRVLRH
jgi:uncharacterized RDD family membrane protein YckC